MPDHDRIVVYPAKDGWRWHKRAAGNNEMVAESGEAYERKEGAIEAAERERGEDESIEIEVIEPTEAAG